MPGLWQREYKRRRKEARHRIHNAKARSRKALVETVAAGSPPAIVTRVFEP
jgi:hypothetical protein